MRSLLISARDLARRLIFPLTDAGAITIILISCLAAYGNSLFSPFHFDDYADIIDNNLVRGGYDPASLWLYSPTRFLLFSVLTIEYSLFGLNTSPYHIVSLLIHAGVSVEVFFLAGFMFKRVSPGAFLNREQRSLSLQVALIFALHPLQTSSVAYIAKVALPLLALFYFGALLSFFAYVKTRSFVYYLGALALTVLAMLTKPVSITLPFAMLLALVTFYPQVKVFSARSITRAIPFAVSLLIIPLLLWIYGSVEILHESGDITRQTDEISRLSYFSTEMPVLCAYLRLMFIPFGQNIDHDVPLYHSMYQAEVFPCFLFLTILFLSGIHLLGRRPLLGFGILWFFLVLSVESTIIPIADVMVEYRLYLALFGFALAVTAMVREFLKEKRISFNITVLVFSAYLALSVVRNYIWSDGVRLWTDAATKAPANPRCYYNLANSYMLKGDFRNAIVFFSWASTLEPRYIHAHANLFSTYVNIGWVEGAERQIKRLKAIGRIALADRCERLLALFLEKRDEFVPLESYERWKESEH